MNGEVFKNPKEDEDWIDPYPRKKRSLGWLAGIILFLAAYVLSSGPAFRYAKSHAKAFAVFDLLYEPLNVLCDAHPSIDHFFDWYIDLWLPKQSPDIPPFF